MNNTEWMLAQSGLMSVAVCQWFDRDNKTFDWVYVKKDLKDDMNK